MRVLVACEFSGIVREAFQRRGHDAWSCDLLPAEDGSKFHLQARWKERSRTLQGIADAMAGQWGGATELTQAAE